MKKSKTHFSLNLLIDPDRFQSILMEDGQIRFPGGTVGAGTKATYDDPCTICTSGQKEKNIVFINEYSI